jgi:hypothetical protein
VSETVTDRSSANIAVVREAFERFGQGGVAELWVAELREGRMARFASFQSVEEAREEAQRAAA